MREFFFSSSLCIASKNITWNHPFSKYAKFSEKLIFLVPWYACTYQGIRNVCFREILRTHKMYDAYRNFQNRFKTLQGAEKISYDLALFTPFPDNGRAKVMKMFTFREIGYCLLHHNDINFVHVSKTPNVTWHPNVLQIQNTIWRMLGLQITGTH